jgi:phosphoribosylformimino-5-aminoimidazole carboxamide ribotide isomerase
MQVIPVIDLMQGQVVHARKGMREHYQPIQSSLCKGSDAMDIVAALLYVFPFDSLYIADLDAIQNNGNNFNLINKLHNKFPRLSLWVDAGIADTPSYLAWQARHLGRAVLGTETLRDESLLATNPSTNNTPVLSLDFHGGQFRGPPALLLNPAHWPQDVIAMTLNRVGSDNGPDFAQLTNLLHLASTQSPAKKIYAAGGVRHVADLRQLRDMGVTGVLVASAIHNGQLGRDEFAPFAA